MADWSARPGYDRHGPGMATQRGPRAHDFAQQILRTTAPFRTKPMDEMRVLDVGCGYGFTSLALSEHVAEVIGIEPVKPLYELALSLLPNKRRAKVSFRCMDISDLEDEAVYDLIVLDNVFEHLANQSKALGVISRALAPQGLLYLLTPNRLWPVEVHYGLPFLSYLPLPLANLYLRLSGRGTDYRDASYAPIYWGLNSLLDAQSSLSYQYVLPADLSLTTVGARWHYRLGVALIRRFPPLWAVSKSFLVIAIRNDH